MTGASERGVAVVLAYYAPPALGVASNRLTALLRHLAGEGWDPVLVAPASVHHHRVVGEGGIPDGVQVVRVPNPEPSRWLRALAGGGAEDSGGGPTVELRPVETGAVGAWARKLVADWVYVPDAQLLWIPAARRAATQALRQARGRRRVLFSTSVPYSAHFAARGAAREVGAPWVAEYRDPWSVQPPGPGARPALRRVLDRRMDHGLATSADRLVVTSEATRALFLGAFPELDPGRVSVVRNGWEEPAAGAPSATPPEPDAPLLLVYAGSLLDAAWGRPFLGAVAEVLAEHPGAVRLEVHGPEEPWRSLAGEHPDGAPWLTLRGMSDQPAVAAALRGASATVLLQPDAVSYVPGKTYDYVGARRPVLADVAPGTETLGLLEEHGEVLPLHGLEAQGMAGVIRGLVHRHRMGALREPVATADRVAPLSRGSQMARLARVFDQVARP